MAIICDICKEDVTPDEDSEIGKEFIILRIREDKICLCMDCENAVSEYLKSEECKKKCLEFKEQFK